MSIKSDNWIRRMARQHGLIEPFEPEQVRYHGVERVISYGTSSYGYDVRCAREFKIFTNINSTIVAPKQFDMGKLTAPKTVPKEVKMIVESEEPPSAAGVIGGVPGGVGGGVLG